MTMNWVKRAALFGAAAVLLASCATLRKGADQGIVRTLERHLDAGRGRELAELSQVPFLLDGEVVVLPEDVLEFWTAVASADWGLQGARIEAGSPVDDQSWRRFADTQEVRSFFKRYVDPRARLIELTGPAGEQVLVLAQEKLFSWRLLGFGVKP